MSQAWKETVDFSTVATVRAVLCCGGVVGQGTHPRHYFFSQLGPMQTFGELALEDSDSKRKAAVVAVDETWLLGITGADYHMVQVRHGDRHTFSC